jgi:hypothetical protein
MFTVNYKGFYIFCYIDSDDCYIQGYEQIKLKSLLAAKQRVTKLIKGVKQ